MRLSRLLVAPILALALLVSVAETLVADACDRDAGTTAMSATDTGNAGDSREPDGHPAHLCHCVHTHVGVAAAAHRGTIVQRDHAIEIGHQSAPSSIHRAPPSRPPLRVNA